jgi:formylglycine-generating enzyme required for sulfatase activity
VTLATDAVKEMLQREQKPAVAAWHGWPKDAPAPAIAPFDAKQAQKHQQDWATYLNVDVEYKNSLGMRFVLIPPGEFMMGSTPEEMEEGLKASGGNEHWQACLKSEGPRHKVILTKPIYLGVHEVTQGQYEKAMGTNPSYFAKNGQDRDYAAKVFGLDTTGHPVEGATWDEVVEFCVKLSEKEKLKPCYGRSEKAVTMLAGTGYRLPTEAEWEFACRAGTTTRFWIGDKEEDLPQIAWFLKNSDRRTHHTGELKANPLGLHDVHGNVWEWMQDEWDPAYYEQFQDKPAENPTGPIASGSWRVVRGGGGSLVAALNTSSRRFASIPNSAYADYGFRVALSVEAVQQSRQPPP